MLNLTRHKCICCIINIAIIVSFLWSDLVLALPNADCLAPSTHVSEIISDLIPYHVIQTLESAELPDFKVFYDKEVEEKIAGNSENVRCFGVRDRNKWAFYIVDLKSRQITRFVSSSDVKDKFFTVLNRIESPQCIEVIEFEKHRKEVYKLNDKIMPFITECVKRLPKLERKIDELKSIFEKEAEIFDMRPAPMQKVVTYLSESANPYVTVQVQLGNVIKPEDVDVQIHCGRQGDTLEWEDVRDIGMSLYKVVDPDKGVYLYRGKIPLRNMQLGVYRFTTKVLLKGAEEQDQYTKWHNLPKNDGILVVTEYSEFERGILSLYPEPIKWVGRHAERLARLSQVMAREIIDSSRHIPKISKEEIRIAALAHDLGKGASPEMIDAINSAGGYRPVIKEHGKLGVKVLQDNGIFDTILEQVVEFHHTPWVIEDEVARFIAEIVYVADQIDTSQSTDRKYRGKEIADVDKLCREIEEERDAGKISKELCKVVVSLLERRDRPFIDILYEARKDVAYKSGPADVKTTREQYRERSKTKGGKGVGLDDIAPIREKVKEITGVDYEVPDFETITVQEGWVKLLESNKELIDEGNFINSNRQEVMQAIRGNKTSEYPQLRLLPEYIKKKKPGQDLDIYLDTFIKFLIQRIECPISEFPIKEKLARLGPVIIARSSGVMEDQFEKSMAGVFPSVICSGQWETEDAVNYIFQSVIEEFWVNKRGQLKPDENGFAVILQNFVEADKGGVALTNGRGRVSIEAVVGRPTTAVKQEKPNATIYDCGVSGNSDINFNIVQCFAKYPYEIDNAEGGFNRTNSRKRVAELWEKGTTDVRGYKSPLTEDEIKKVALVVKAIEDILEYPVDIEFVIKDGKIYLLQKRPCIGVQQQATEPISDKVDQVTVTISAGKPYRSEKPLPVVIFSERERITPEAVAWLVEKYGETGYVKVQNDVISEEYHIQPDKITGQKVLVDPDSGTRNAHNMQLFRDKFGGDFVYLAGPKLKPWLRNLSYYEPVPNGGILVSNETVMVESNGEFDYGGMYLAREESSGGTSKKEPWYLAKMRGLLETEEKTEENYEEGFNEIMDKLELNDFYSKEELELLKAIIMSYAKIQLEGENLSEKTTIEYLTEYYLSNSIEAIEALREKLNLISYIINFYAIWPFDTDSVIVDILGKLESVHKFCSDFLERFYLIKRALGDLLNRRKNRLRLETGDVKNLRESIKRLRRLIEGIEKREAESAGGVNEEETAVPEKTTGVPIFLKALIVDDSYEEPFLYGGKTLQEAVRLMSDGNIFRHIYNLKKKFEGQQVVIRAISDYNEALKYIQEEKPDIIIADNMLNEQYTGTGLAREVCGRMSNYNPRMYLMTAGAWEFDATMLFEKILHPIHAEGQIGEIIRDSLRKKEVSVAKDRVKQRDNSTFSIAIVHDQAPVFRAVILDDESENRRAIIDIIKDACEVEGCPLEIRDQPVVSGTIEWILENRPQVIMADLYLEGIMHGDEFLREVLAAIGKIKDYKPKLFLVTGATRLERLNDLKELGVTILVKPNIFERLRDETEDIIAEIQGKRAASVASVTSTEGHNRSSSKPTHLLEKRDISRKEEEHLFTVTFDENGVKTSVVTTTAKSGLYNEQDLKDAIDVLVREYGAGILSGIKRIEIADRNGNVGCQVDNRIVIDIDVFRDKNLVLEVLEHEALHEILGLLLPGEENKALREAIATLASANRFLKLADTDQRRRIDLYKDKSNGLDPEEKYALFLETIIIRKMSEEDLIKAVISFVEMSLDKKVFVDAVRLFNDGLDLLGDFSEAGRLTDVIKETTQQAVKVVKTFSDSRIVGKCSDRVRKLIGLIVRYDKWDLPKGKDISHERYIVIGGDRKKYELKNLEAELLKYNIYIVNDLPQGVEPKYVVVLVDPEDTSKWQGMDMNYLPLPYMEQSLKMAAIMVLNDGIVEKRSLLFNFVKSFYDILLDRKDRGLTEDEVLGLFKTPWSIWDEIERLKEDLDVLRRAARSLDKDA